MFGLTPLVVWAFIGLLFTNMVTLTLWRVEVSRHALTKTEQAEMAVKAAQAATNRLEEAARLNARIVGEVSRQEQEINRLNKEKNDALRKLTTGRPCLGSRAVGLLNSPGKPGTVPDARPGAVPTDESFASDTDVALWAADAQRAYDTCRGRLAGIAQFYEGEP